MAIKTPSTRSVLPKSKPKVDLRDYYLAAALTGLCANSRHDLTPGEIATKARMIADEVLIERTR